MEKNERNSIDKWTRRSMWAALPVALLANGIAQDVARGGAYYPLGAVILDGAMGLAVLLLAFITVKRHELLRKLPDRKMFLLALGGFIGGILLALFYLYLVSELRSFQNEINAQLEVLRETGAAGAGETPPLSWGEVGLAFLAIVVVFLIPFLLVPAWILLWSVVLAAFWGTGVNSIDDGQWHLEGAVQAFAASPAGQANPMKENLSRSETLRIRQTALCAAGFFLTWLARRDALGGIHAGRRREVEHLRDGRLSGANFLAYYCNARLIDRDVAPEYLEFVRIYYPEYLSDFGAWYLAHRNPDDWTYVGNFEDYLEFSRVIDENYLSYSISRGIPSGEEEDGNRAVNLPFALWLERGIPGAVVERANRICQEAQDAVEGLADVPETERVTAFTEILQRFVHGFNILDRYNSFIETLEREEIYDAAHALFCFVCEECALSMTESEFSAALDRNREW